MELIKKKISILGRANTGKSSIKNIIFKGKKSEDLLINPLEPTRGISHSIFSLYDINLGLIDVSGQELDSLIEDEIDRKRIFEGTNIIIYVFDYLKWLENPHEIKDDILKVIQNARVKESHSKIVIFFHKIDLMTEKKRENLKELERNIHQFLGLLENLDLYFTSIMPKFLFSIHNAFSEIFSNFSKETFHLKRIVDEFLVDYPKTLCYLNSKNNNIIVQSKIKDFNINYINNSHKLIIKLIGYLKEQYEDDSLISFSNPVPQNFTVIIDDIIYIYIKIIEQFFDNLKHIILVSEDLKTDELSKLVEKIELKLLN